MPRYALQLVVFLALAAASPTQGGPFAVDVASTGMGPLYPYRIRQLDAFGNPTNIVLEIRSRETLAQNLSAVNGVLPVAQYPTVPRLPNGAPGNQFLLVRFTHDLDLTSVLSGLPASQVNSFLTGALSVLVWDPVGRTTTMARGQAFVGGKTYYDDPSTPQLDPRLVQAVVRVGNRVVVLDPRANGFPLGFPGDVDLVDDRAFVFVPSADADLSTFETFPVNRVLRVLALSQIVDTGGAPLSSEVCTATTVGQDPNPAQVLTITPGSGQSGVDPRTSVLVSFDKPVQPYDVGRLVGSGPAALGGVALTVLGMPTFPVTTYAEPVTSGDMCSYQVLPAYPLPGFTTVQVQATAVIRALNGVPLAAPFTTTFATGQGQGIVNAPVAPEAIYVGAGGANPGVSVIDVNGFGQGTGSLATTTFPQNPNVGRPGVVPALAPGSSSLDAGGAGRLTLTEDHLGRSVLVGSPLLLSARDIQIGQPLDLVYDNTNINVTAIGANQVNPATMSIMPGNTISVAPHPNPPRLVFPPPNPARGIFGEEPTVTSSQGPPGRVLTTSPPCLPVPPNILVPGPSGLLGATFSGVFYGPQPPPPSPPPPLAFCPYTSRQQVGHFLYVLDRNSRSVAVLNSNRFTVLATLRLPDPFSMALSPNLLWLAVSNFASGTVSLIDVDPLSANFHAVLAEIAVGRGPTGLAWQPEGEDLLVCNSLDSTVSIISAQSGQVRRVLGNLIRSPIDVAVTARQDPGLGAATGTWFAFVLNGDGTVAAYESGPSPTGPDAVLGLVPAAFRSARSIHAAPGRGPGCWVTHTDAGGFGQLSRIGLAPPPVEPRAKRVPALPQPSTERFFAVTRRIGGGGLPAARQLSGNAPVDLAFDDVRNRGAMPDKRSSVVPGLLYARHSGKGRVKVSRRGRFVAAQWPLLVFVAVADAGKVDVFDLATGLKVRSIVTPGVTTLADYWRQ